jgi:hypothetical protein
LAETLIEYSEQLQPSPRAQKQALVGPEPGLANFLVTCSASAQGCADALGLGSVSAQVKAATLRMEAVTGTREKKSYIRLYRYLMLSMPKMGESTDSKPDLSPEASPRDTASTIRISLPR